MRNIVIDLGNKNYKMLIGDKKVLDSSNVEEVQVGTFGAFEIDSKYYIIGEGAKAKRNTNKVCGTKRALLARALFPVIEDKEKIEITTLLPLSLYINQENKQKYAELLKGKYTVTHPNGAKKSFTVASVDVRAESFSSLVTDENLLKDALYLVDIGGVDTTGVFVNRTPNVNQMFTNEVGMNIFYKELGTVLTSKLLESYSDKDAELVYKKYESLNDELKAMIDTFAESYIQKNIYEHLKEIGYKSLIHKLVFVGGGSVALERYLSKDSNVKILDNAIFSNVEGAKLMSMRRGR